jgi:hypothetical protein
MIKQICLHHVSRLRDLLLAGRQSDSFTVYELSSRYDNDTSGNDSERYQLFVQDQMPRQVRQQLIAAVERELEPVEERLRIQLPNIVRIVHREMLQAFLQSLQSNAPTIAQSTAPLVLSTDDQAQVEQSIFQLTAEDDPLGMWWDSSLADNFAHDMGQPMFHNDLPTATSAGFFSDSGYGVMSGSATPILSNFASHDSNTCGAKVPPDSDEAGPDSPCTVLDEEEDGP